MYRGCLRSNVTGGTLEFVVDQWDKARKNIHFEVKGHLVTFWAGLSYGFVQAHLVHLKVIGHQVKLGWVVQDRPWLLPRPRGFQTGITPQLDMIETSSFQC